VDIVWLLITRREMTDVYRDGKVDQSSPFWFGPF